MRTLITPSHTHKTLRVKSIEFLAVLGMMMFWPGRSGGCLVLLGNWPGDRFFKLNSKKSHSLSQIYKTVLNKQPVALSPH